MKNSKIWSNYNPVKVKFGQGSRLEIISVLKNNKCLIVCSTRGRSRISNDKFLFEPLEKSSCIWVDSIEANPDIQDLQKLIIELTGLKIDVVVAIGGGSVIDTAKILALALSNAATGISLETLVETGARYESGVGLPLYALPTSAGTGSEVTPFATIWDHSSKKKLSLAGPAMYPQYAFVDSELTYSLTEEVTLSSGLDAINQALESIWNKNMTPATELLAQRSLVLSLEALPKLINNLRDKKARDAMSEASLLAGLAISHTKTALCHAISYPLTLNFGVHHGFACAFTMTEVLSHCLIKDDGRLRRLALTLGCNNISYKQELIDIFKNLNLMAKVNENIKKKVGAFDDLLELADEMNMPGRSENIIVPINKSEIANLLRRAWEA